MKYFVAACAFVAIHIFALYVLWMHGAVLERGTALGGMSFAAALIGGTFAWLVIMLWKDK